MERMPPRLMLLYLSLVGISVLFAGLVGMYVFTRLQHGGAPSGHALPRYFSLSTIVLLVSSATLAQARRLYQADDLPNLVRCLGATLLLGSIFCGLALLLRTLHAARDGVRTLVFIRNPYRRRQLRGISAYWHFVDAIWVALFAVFLFMY